MTTRVHMGFSVRGALNWDRRYAKRMLNCTYDKDGNRFPTVDAMRNALMDELAQGHEVLPMGDCDAWDYKKGCPGHKTDDEGAT